MDIDIERDNSDVEKMLLAAKSNKWKTVFEILEKKSYLINCITETRAWAALHQAVYWNNRTVVANLLRNEACDTLVKSKPCLDKMIDPNSTALDLAKSKGYKEIEKLLEDNMSNLRMKRFSDDVLRFVLKANGDKFDEMGFPLLVLGIVLYKKTLTENHTNVQRHSVDLMKSIFKKEKHDWKSIRDKLLQALYSHCKDSAEYLYNAHAENEAKFYEALIRLYTSHIVFKDLNIALGRELKDDYTPSATDLALSMYALLLDITVTYWPKLNKVEAETYRGISTNVTTKYKANTEIIFAGMVSCSLSKKEAQKFQKEGTLFVFDNTERSDKRPRNIQMYSAYGTEEECLYVLGSTFKVVSVQEQTKTVNLKLL